MMGPPGHDAACRRSSFNGDPDECMRLAASSVLVLTLTVSACGGIGATQSAVPKPSPTAEPSPLERALTGGLANPIVRNGPEAFDVVKAGPRSVVKVADRDYRMWYEAIEGNGDTRVAYATSTNGTTWVKRGVVLGFSVAWECNEVSPTTVLFDPDANLWKMWYHGGGNDGRRFIGHATSPDGLVWTKYSANPILSPGSPGGWDDDYIADAKVLRLSSTDYRLWYKGVHVATQVGQVGYATSSDGVAWVKHAGNPVFTPGPAGAWDDASLNGPAVLHDRGLFHMWYPGIGNEAAVSYAPGDGIGYASSVDGVSWIRGSSNPVLAPRSGIDARESEFGDTVDAYGDGQRYRIIYGEFNLSMQPVLRGMAEAYLRVPATAAVTSAPLR